ncbi:DICT sensory domain-containing protein [Halobacterium yunchengense]|uniref:DICT sensory domain-containing protein n=1 Tax=Halobacterium yunchengense TaxID=3108497 RepID=UPI00300892E2
MTLADVLDAARRRRKTLVVHGADPGDLPERFETRNVEVVGGGDVDPGQAPYVTVREDGDFRAAVDLADLEAFFAAPGRRDAGDAAARHALHELLDDAVFASLSRRQLLSTAVEIEDRAYRTGRGELHAGFQTWAAFAEQADRYRRLAAETDLEVTVYVEPGDGGQRAPDGVAVRETAHPDVGEYWFVVFDGGDADQQCALVAEQTGSEAFRGAWTYDEALVAAALAAVDDLASPPSP